MRMLPKINVRTALVSALLIGFFMTSCSVSKKYVKEATAKWEKDIAQFEQQKEHHCSPWVEISSQTQVQIPQIHPGSSDRNQSPCY